MTDKEKLLFLNEKVGNLHLVDGIDCKKCNNRGFSYVIKTDGELVSTECSCMLQRKIKRNIMKSGLEEQFNLYTFKNFLTTEAHHKFLKQKALEYLEDTSNAWWVVVGQVGVGKTHITVAILNELAKSGKNFYYMRYATEMPRIQRGLVNFNVDVKEKAERDLAYLKAVDILYIDDYLKIRDTSHLFELIDYRYANDLKTLITSELNYKEQANVDEAVASRIFEKSKKYYNTILKDEKKNYRKKD